VVLVWMALASFACGKQAPADPPAVTGGPIVSVSLGASPSARSTPSLDPPAPTGTSGGSVGGESRSSFTSDDLKVFAYSTTDEGKVAADLTDAAAVVARAEADARARNLPALKTDASALATDADRLAGDADAGEARQRPLDPKDDTLVEARKDAIAVFGQAVDYATLASHLAELAANPSLQTLQQVLQLAGQLDGAGSSLGDDLDQLNQLLETWATANPAAAARALATYAD
jgi:hypothetical protein